MANSTDQTNSENGKQPTGDDGKDVLQRARAKIAELNGLRIAPDALQARMLSELGIDSGADEPTAGGSKPKTGAAS